MGRAFLARSGSRAFSFRLPFCIMTVLQKRPVARKQGALFIKQNRKNFLSAAIEKIDGFRRLPHLFWMLFSSPRKGPIINYSFSLYLSMAKMSSFQGRPLGISPNFSCRPSCSKVWERRFVSIPARQKAFPLVRARAIGYNGSMTHPVSASGRPVANLIF